MRRASPGSRHPFLPAWTVLVLGFLLALGPLAPPGHAADGGEGRAGSGWTVRQPGKAHDGVSAVVRLDPADGTVTLAARRGATTVLEPAPVGLVTRTADLTSGLRLLSRGTRRVTEHYTMTTGKRLRRTVRATEARFSFTGAGGTRLDLLVRVSHDGVAHRYVLPARGEVTVVREASAFRPPATARAWLSSYTPNYERTFAPADAANAPDGSYAYPALFRVGGTYALLTESDVDGRYDGSHLVHRQGTAEYTVALADASVTSTGPLATPWRTAVIGDLATVTESTLVDDLAPPSRVADTSWIRPGKVAWSWLAGFGAAQRSLATQERFVDYSAAHGWPYTLVDDGWKTTDWMPRLIDYARARGVGVLLWVHYTDLDTAAERAELLPRVKKWGAAGLKIDFMDSDSQERFAWYDDILRDTAREELLVNFHGATLPKGIQRTWPQVMTMEAVYGAEQGNVPAADLATLPYTRNAVGSMDYTPMGFQFGTRTVSDAAELALSVVYESGFQNFAGSVAAYRDRPELERFLEQVPTVWDASRLLSGEPGQEATFARRRDGRWFLGSVGAGPAGQRRVPLSFLGGGKWLLEVVRDGDDGLVREGHVLTRHDTLRVPVHEHGGFAALVCRAAPGRDTCDRPVSQLPLTTLTVSPGRADVDAGASIGVDARFAVEDAGPAQDVTVTLRTPDGWSVAGDPARADRVGTGGELVGHWTVRVPPDAAEGGRDLVVTTKYRAGAQVLTVERTVRAYVSPPGVDHVGDLPFVSESNGWGPVERDMSNGETAAGDGEPLTLRGTVHDKGLGVHAESEVVVDLDGAYRRFTAAVGVDDEVAGKGSVVFEVLGDGRTLATTPVLTSADAARALDVDVSGVRRLTLRVTDGEDGVDSDHADWGDARLLS
ncbi:glycoside hydrolase family 97 catalytic domain-containing protein [Streptomyces sp. ME02-6978.2a]|uniref:glycoside hydrolase family 97 catalytic domain-containing protein n=1 Tax=Streptomyces sp. ME02-6978.2a TaxID=462922 RepID=UPI0029BD884C|nr:glycoside hydrolase family 97 catalytic domain-containing protein [Streptomyces sp. ME02-6978.2a]MDX3358656.1 glycoside hydrolase family 97 catalytic domain-containing protein [Streptomyces sp. ME02-6978.2a]